MPLGLGSSGPRPSSKARYLLAIGARSSAIQGRVKAPRHQLPTGTKRTATAAPQIEEAHYAYVGTPEAPPALGRLRHLRQGNEAGISRTDRAKDRILLPVCQRAPTQNREGQQKIFGVKQCLRRNVYRSYTGTGTEELFPGRNNSPHDQRPNATCPLPDRPRRGWRDQLELRLCPLELPLAA